MSGDQNTQAIQEQNRKEDEEDRGGIFGWLYRWYKRYDTWSGRWDWFNWLVNLFKAHTVATTVATTTAVVAVGGAVVMTNPSLREKWLPVAKVEQPSGDVKVETQKWGSSVIFPIEGKDLSGKRAAFDVAVLPKDLSWASKSDTVLNHGDARIAENDVVQRVFTPELRDGLSRSPALIAVGLASQEGQLQEEAQRAGRRAATAAGWLATAFGDTIGIWMLNLGQFRGSCKASTEATDTGWQRPLIIVGIRSQEDGVNLGEAFADAISGKSNLPSRDCYTSFDLTRFR